uniref:Cytochrome c oxidase subunit 2 n=1 Tax=Macrocentrus camphoraphilus TaxID=684659 RepID=D8WHC7_9HYME|nr:cytochrome c oxidase subunit II [Macrocentrus camphoraphilus]
MNTWMMMNLQDSNSYNLTMMIYFHDFILMILLMILVMILYIFIWFMMNNLMNLIILHNQLLELIWTLIPILILLFMAIPSLSILYNIEESLNSEMMIKILGHQWYWSYEYSDFLEMSFDSFMIKNFNLDNFRLLDVDNRLILPNKFKICSMVSSMDVIHSWAMPSLGIKVDAIPGRLNQFMMLINRSGLYFGQCSEICGMNHSFMPIVLEVMNFNYFLNWLKMN